MAKAARADGLSDDLHQGALDAARLRYHYTNAPRTVPDEATVNTSDDTICTDHMICAYWTQEAGWTDPVLKPYGALSLSPTASCLHYATECFEGMKVWRGADGRLRLFRPELNGRRFLASATRISLPPFEPREVDKLVRALVAADGPRWLGAAPGSFLYLRPAMIGTDPQLGVRAPKEAMLFIVMSFMARLDTIPGGMHLRTSPDDAIRSWTGGFGHAKVGSNYGPSVKILREAQKDGFHQVLWLYGADKQCTELGGSNFFLVWKRKDGQQELITAPLDDQLILDGITRRSCIELTRERLSPELVVHERTYTIADILEAASEDRIVEAFTVGTAYFVSAISRICHKDKTVGIPMGKEGKGGKITCSVKAWLEDIMCGRVEHPWATIVPATGRTEAAGHTS